MSETRPFWMVWSEEESRPTWNAATIAGRGACDQVTGMELMMQHQPTIGEVIKTDQTQMHELVARVQKVRDDTARTMLEDIYAKDCVGNLKKLHSKEAGEAQLMKLDSILDQLSAMNNV